MRVAVLAIALALVGAAPAAADSIAYVKDGNVWLATPDGQRQFQVTATGGYSDVSQADDGTMIALKGVRLHRLDRTGNVLADFDTPVSDTRPAPSKTFYGPFDPAISPDGTKVAYTYYYMTQSQDGSCFPPTCVTTINEAGTGYSLADRQTAWDVSGLGRHSGWRHPAWVDNDTTMLGNPSHLPNFDVILDTLSDGSTGNLVHNWFSDAVGGNPHVSGGDITRDRTKLAFQTGENDSTLTVYAVPSFPTAFKDGDADPSTRPSPCYRYSDAPGGRFSQPTFSPDGAGLAWSAGDGIHVAAVPTLAAGCTIEGATPAPPLVIAGGSEPDWGPADVPAPRASGQSTSASSRGATNLAVTVRRTTLRAALRKGLRISVDVPAAGRLAAIAQRKGRTLAKAPARSVKAGKRTLTLKFRKAARRALSHGHSAKVTIRVTLTPKGAAQQTTKLSATLKSR
ncbi:MAG TPA: hypothetical protein VFY32_01765 [Solirubrobacteraceae bacterium]|nr:hypothetical protein [Solirubrobacteraceae bacterium]